ncbi:hypothetical protein LEP1GSC132_2333 [Leptospira kirschneri str. 200803703]|nr:hypothetical protein LEP1GSC132_2333 [Leptospira kirschneri str. 200803703]
MEPTSLNFDLDRSANAVDSVFLVIPTFNDFPFGPNFRNLFNVSRRNAKGIDAGSIN